MQHFQKVLMQEKMIEELFKVPVTIIICSISSVLNDATITFFEVKLNNIEASIFDNDTNY